MKRAHIPAVCRVIYRLFCSLCFVFQLVVQWTLVSGVKRQIDALREGFNSVLPLSNLASFSYTEVVNLKKIPCSLLFPRDL